MIYIFQFKKKYKVIFILQKKVKNEKKKLVLGNFSRAFFNHIISKFFYAILIFDCKKTNTKKDKINKQDIGYQIKINMKYITKKKINTKENQFKLLGNNSQTGNLHLINRYNML